MKLEGGCYAAGCATWPDGEPMMKAQCHCRECQYFSGGSPKHVLLMPPPASATPGTPGSLPPAISKRGDAGILCEYGTHLMTLRPRLPPGDLKVGTLRPPACMGPQMAIFTIDKQAFHHIPRACRLRADLPNR